MPQGRRLELSERRPGASATGLGRLQRSAPIAGAPGSARDGGDPRPEPRSESSVLFLENAARVLNNKVIASQRLSISAPKGTASSPQGRIKSAIAAT